MRKREIHYLGLYWACAITLVPFCAKKSVVQKRISSLFRTCYILKFMRRSSVDSLSGNDPQTVLVIEGGNQNDEKNENLNRDSTEYPHNFGVIGIKIINAVNLPIADVNTSDPYIKLYGMTSRSFFYFGKSKTIYKNLNPEWNEIMFMPSVCASTILIEIYDYDFGRSDDFLAKLEIPVYKLFQNLELGEIENEKNEKIQCFTKDPVTFDLVSLEKREENDMKITLQPFVPYEEKYDLETKEIPCNLCIAYLNAKTQHPLLKIRELDKTDKILQTSKNTYENGIIKTPYKDIFSKSYCIKLDSKESQDEYSKFQFYLESFQETKSTLETKNYIVFVGMPNVHKTVLTFDTGLALDFSNRKNWPFYTNAKNSDMDPKNVYRNDRGHLILSNQQLSNESEYTKIEKEIENASLDQIPRIYKEFNRLVGTIFANPTQDDYLFHRDDVAKLCQKLIEKIRSTPTLPYEHEIMCLRRTKYILENEFTGNLRSKNSFL